MRGSVVFSRLMEEFGNREQETAQGDHAAKEEDGGKKAEAKEGEALMQVEVRRLSMVILTPSLTAFSGTGYIVVLS